MAPIVTIQPDLIRWARLRADLDEEGLAQAVGVKSPDVVREWERTGALKMSQLEKLASKTYTPLGYLFLPEPPDERLPIPDFRTLPDASIGRPSPNLLDVIYHCQLRQDWLREYLQYDGAERLDFVGTASTSDEPVAVAAVIRSWLGWDRELRATATTWEEALRLLVARAEALGITVMRSGIVGNNTHRKLDPREFRGFCLSDSYAPLIFVNGADAVSAQMFTLAHELAHIWIGASGVSNATLVSDSAEETFCNRVAAELLVPLAEFAEAWQRGRAVNVQLEPVARRFKVSGLVVLIRAFEAGFLSEGEFRSAYDSERARAFERRAAGGGDFYRTQGSRLGKRFIQSVLGSTLEGRTTYTEAFQLLGIRKSSTFNSLVASFMGGA